MNHRPEWDRNRAGQRLIRVAALLTIKSMTAPQVANKLGVSVKTARRDCLALEQVLPLVVSYDQKPIYYRIPPTSVRRFFGL